jgi:hypothetical protein
VSVLDDGTVLLSSSTQLTWVFADGTTRLQPLRLDDKDLRVNGGFRDGLLLQPHHLNKRAPVYFVPVVNHELRFATKFLVTDEPGVPVDSPPRFVRSGKWLTYGHFLINLSTRVCSKVEGLHPVAMPSASDGETVVFWSWPNHVAVSQSSGTQVPVDFGRPQNHCEYIFAARNGIGYFFDYDARRAQERTLRAISLSGKPILSDALMTVQFPGRNRTIYDFEHIPHLLADDALLIWNGSTWEEVHWLKELDSHENKFCLRFNRPFRDREATRD